MARKRAPMAKAKRGKKSFKGWKSRVRRNRQKGDFFFTKTRLTIDATSSGSGTFYLTLAQNSPTQTYINGSSAVQTLTDFQQLALCFDEYRIAGIRIKYQPFYFPSSQGVGSGRNVMVNVVQDCDNDVSTAITVAQMEAGYQKLCTKPALSQNPWACYFRNGKTLSQKGGSGITWGNGQRPGWQNTSTTAQQYATTSVIAIGIDAGGLLASEVFGRFLITYYVKFHKRI